MKQVSDFQQHTEMPKMEEADHLNLKVIQLDL